MKHVVNVQNGRTRRPLVYVWASVALVLLFATGARAQSAGTGWVFDAGIGIDSPINGNVNSGAIGFIGTDAAAILPQSYKDVYGTGIQLRFGGGYMARSTPPTGTTGSSRTSRSRPATPAAASSTSRPSRSPGRWTCRRRPAC